LPDVNETPEPPKPSTKPASGTAPPASIPENQSAQQQHQPSPNKSIPESSVLVQAQANKSAALQYQRLAFTQVGSTPPQLDAALSNINASIQLNPDDGMSWKLKGIVLQAAENYEQAYMAYTEALVRLEGPEKQTVQQTLSLLAMLKQAQQTEAAKRAQYIPQNPIAQTPLSTQTSTQASTQISPIALARSTQMGLITPQPTTVEQTQASQGLPAPKPILLEPPSSSSVTHPLLEEIRALKHPRSRDLLMTLTRKCRGALYLVEFNGLGSVDQVALFFLGYNYTASQRLDMPCSPPTLHPSWGKLSLKRNIDVIVRLHLTYGIAS
jgi:tetratricopeptide (TPR) repeat protein